MGETFSQGLRHLVRGTNVNAIPAGDRYERERKLATDKDSESVIKRHLPKNEGDIHIQKINNVKTLIAIDKGGRKKSKGWSESKEAETDNGKQKRQRQKKEAETEQNKAKKM